MKFLSTLQLSAMSLFLLFAAGVAPAKAQVFGPPGGCSWAHGGSVYRCAQMANALRPGHRVPAGSYSSAGVMVLHRAGCVERGAVFRFHSASNPDPSGAYSPFGPLGAIGKVQSPLGNRVMEQYLAKWPRLVQHLRQVGAFSSLNMTIISAEELTWYGVPLCR